jgi:hypothetical protein
MPVVPSRLHLFTEQDNYTSPSEPTETMTFSSYGLSGYDVQYWDGSSWVTITGGSVTSNNNVWRKFTFSSITSVTLSRAGIALPLEGVLLLLNRYSVNANSHPH